MPSRSKEKRLTLQRPKPVEIADAAVAKMLAEIPDMVTTRMRQFTPTEDKLILAGWKSKAKADLARYIGISINTLRRRHNELVAQGSKGFA